jgi:protein-L-isoaspartate(D-aspartate) O-methyltransferase
MAAAHVTQHSRVKERAAMVRRVLELIAETSPETGVAKLDARVRAALEAVPRHRFVPDREQSLAYADAALPIGYGQTISQPFIVALMTQLADVSPGSNVLEVGAGSGYQAALLGELAQQVHSIEIVPELAQRATAVLSELGYANVQVSCGDGCSGWEKHAPFDVILVTAAGPEPPRPLVEQLAVGGRMVIPLGDPARTQDLVLLRKRPDEAVEIVHELPVAFVPLTRADE